MFIEIIKGRKQCEFNRLCTTYEEIMHIKSIGTTIH